MPAKITYGVEHMLAEANAAVTTLNVAEAKDLLEREDVLFVDLRDPRELAREGRIPGAFHCPRGMLEFWIDPASPYAKPQFQQDKCFVFFCAGGLRSALSAHTAQKMGLAPVAHVEGGFSAWKKAGAPIEAPAESNEKGQ
jgi:rhodanese-related sulfurtransferase